MVAWWKMNGKKLNGEKKKKQEERGKMEEQWKNMEIKKIEEDRKEIEKERKQMDETKIYMNEERKMLDEEWKKLENEKKNMEKERKKIMLERVWFTERMEEERKMKEELEIGKEKKKIGQYENMVEKERMEAVLPAEMLERVFRLLPPQDLKTVVLVSRRWREVGEAPALWSWVPWFYVMEENIGYMPEVLGSSRLQAVRRMVVSEVREVSEELLQAVVRHPGLKVMEVGFDSSLSSVDPELLAQAVTQLEEVVLANNHLTTQQVTAICTTMAGNSQLKTLNLSHTDLSSVDANILANAFTQLEKLSLWKNDVSHQQAQAVFAALDSSSHMKILWIIEDNLSSVDPDVLARVVNKLVTVNISSTKLSRQQMTRILTQSLLTTNLKKLFMWENGKIDEQLLKQAEQVIPKLKCDCALRGFR